jgi:hypothetical protein
MSIAAQERAHQRLAEYFVHVKERAETRGTRKLVEWIETGNVVHHIYSCLYFPLNTSSLKTILAPATPELITYAVIGGTITIEIAFLNLDGSDQFGFESMVGLNTVRSGNIPDFHDFHSGPPSACHSFCFRRQRLRFCNNGSITADLNHIVDSPCRWLLRGASCRQGATLF